MFAYRKVQRALRDDRWKLIRYPEVDRTQLFDLKADPFETTNLAGDPRLASTLADLTGRLRAEMDRFGDAAPLTVAKPQPADWSPPAPGVPRPSGLDPR